MERISSWSKMKRVVAIMLRFKDMLLNIIKSNKINSTGQLADMHLLQRSESSVIKMYQQSCFQNETSRLLDGKCVSRESNIFKLDPFLDDHEIIRVGGRIRQSRMEYKLKHPILLPKNGHITSAIIDFYHRKVGHGGRGMTINEIRSNGFWVINCTAAVKSVISTCVDCRKLRGKTCQQKMSDLPEERLIEEPPFCYCGVDMFGPFLVKEGRKIHKRYGAIFTCLCSRAIYIETTNSMTTDSFIQALMRFISRRGNIGIIRSDNGSNFIGASTELKRAYSEMDKKKINYFLMELGGEQLIWKHNSHTASNMGGVWERQIRSARSILGALLKQHGESLIDESLRTLLVEVEGIINSRPITCDNIGELNSIVPLIQCSY